MHTISQPTVNEPVELLVAGPKGSYMREITIFELHCFI